jgi:hypothetical protein
MGRTTDEPRWKARGKPEKRTRRTGRKTL